MDLIVCVKQVPGTSNVEVDPVTGVLKRDGSNVKLNPYDLFALETAFRIKEKTGGRITTLTMGPPQAKSSLFETLYMGADEGVLLTDRMFAGADVQATGYVLKCGVEKIGKYDLILCGKQTTDGDTAQVGPELAEQLGIEHAANVLSIDGIGQGTVTVTVNLDNVYQTQKMKTPCLLTIEKDAYTPRLPSFKRKMETSEDAVKVYTAADLPQIEPERCGLKGSPTQVERIFPPAADGKREIYDEKQAPLADKFYEILSVGKYL